MCASRVEEPAGGMLGHRNNKRTSRTGIVVFAGVILLLGIALSVTPAWAEPPQPDGRYITDWLVAGPLGDKVPLDQLLGSAGDANAKPREGDPVPGHQIRWTRYSGEGNVINLREIAGYGQPVTAMAYCEFNSAAEQKGYVHFASENEFQLWLNGRLVVKKSEGDNATLTPEGYDISLKQGINTCLAVCRSASSWIFGFTLRVDGPETTQAPPLIWNPLVPTAPSEEDGRYRLLSPDWKWRAGDDPAWAKPGFDDSDWERVPPDAHVGLAAGSTYWMRIHARFAPNSTKIPYAITLENTSSAELYLNGNRVFGTGRYGNILNPFRNQHPVFQLPQECVLAVHGIIQKEGQPLARIEVRRADKKLDNALTFQQPQRYHRWILIFCLTSYLIYYFFAFLGHPRQKEGFWINVALALTILSLLISDMACWTNRYNPAFFAWLSQAVAAGAAVCAIAMTYIMTRGALHGRVLAGYGIAAAAVYLYGWTANALWITYLVYPLITIELLRVWIVYGMIPRRENRWYIGSAIIFFVFGQLLATAFALFRWKFFAGMGPYAHLYGFMVLIGNTLDYMARESARGLRELETLTATLESKVAERTQQVSELTQQLITAEEAERERLARELHDSVAQTLWFAKMAAEEGVKDDVRMHKMAELLDKAIGEVRTIAYGLRPPELDKLGFVQAISQLCKDFSYNTGILLDYQAHGVDNVSLSPVAEVNLYRVLQEALNNVQQHAGASKVRVRLVGAYPNVMVRVEDDGRGFDMDQQGMEKEGHMGLSGMEERIRLTGGAMRIKSAPGEGVRIVVEIPQQKEQD